MKKIEIHNKADLTGEPVAVRSDGLAQTGAESVISLSAKTGAGLDLLKHALLQEVGWQGESESLFLARSRHLNALHEAEAELENAALCNNNQIELSPNTFASPKTRAAKSPANLPPTICWA